LIVIDTSALFAIARDEPEGPACLDAIEAAQSALISAGTVAEALIVASGRGYRFLMQGLIEDLGLQVEPVTPAASMRIGEIYYRWGRGMHAASLNFGDCFAYELAQRYGCPLLYIGNDFAQTDIASAI
jgi:ribonuclease VapC